MTSRARGLALAATIAVAAWLPFLRAPLGADESGYLLLARHWSPGTSLYGNYWVARPPLLFALYALVGLGPTGHSALGLTAPGVKLLGAAASATAVILAGVLGHLVSRGARWSWSAATVLAVALLCSPLLGMPETDGEVLAVPFVLLGLVLLTASLQRPWGRGTLLLCVGAGAAGMCAALIKQNFVDVFVFALFAFVVARGHLDVVWRRVAAFAAGSLTLAAVALIVAASRGTSPGGLWEAVVAFRLRASAATGVSASHERAWQLALAFLASGAAPVLLVAAPLLVVSTSWWRSRTGRAPMSVDAGAQYVVWPALAMMAWEVCGVLLGGGYWSHYLTGLVPGLVLIVGLVAADRRHARLVAVPLVYAVIASLAVWGYLLTRPPQASTEAQVGSYLRTHASPGDGVVVAFGNANIVADSGLASPYPYLWQLPVSMRDAHLHQLQRVLAGVNAPRWVVVAGEDLQAAGIDASTAQPTLERQYVERTTIGPWHVWQRRGTSGSGSG